jgi:prophage regulatory protein
MKRRAPDFVDADEVPADLAKRLAKPAGRVKPRFYRLTDLVTLLSVSRSSVYRWIKEGQFPQQTHVGARISVWNADDVDAWITARHRGEPMPPPRNG